MAKFLGVTSPTSLAALAACPLLNPVSDSRIAVVMDFFASLTISDSLRVLFLSSWRYSLNLFSSDSRRAFIFSEAFFCSSARVSFNASLILSLDSDFMSFICISLNSDGVIFNSSRTNPLRANAFLALGFNALN